jgi:hypothetical protein
MSKEQRKEYYQKYNNTEKNKEYQKKYRSTESYKKRSKEYHKEYDKEYNAEHLEQKKKWRKEHASWLKEYQKKWYQEHKEELKEGRREESLKRSYNISIQEYNLLLGKQEGRCAICGAVESTKHHKSKRVVRLAVDHNHKTGKVRGLLCLACNHAIGGLKDDPELVFRAANYLKQHE